MKIQLSDHFTYKKLMRFTMPSVAMMIFTSVYGVVDGFFVSNFAGKTAFAAINMIFPILMILSTVGFMFGTGGAAIVAKTFGEGDDKKANRYFSLFVYVSIVLGISFAVLGTVFIRPISTMLGASGQLLEDCVVYGIINLAALPFYVLQLLFQSFFAAAEKPKLGLVVTVSAGVTNIILDAVLVILLPQKLRLAGAGIATAMSQVVGGALPLIYFARKNDSLLRLGKTRFDGKALLKACTNGSSEFMSNVSMNLVGILYNLQLMKYAGEDGIAAYGVMLYISWIFASAFMGYSMGNAPLISYNYGAKNSAELKGLLRKGLTITGVLGIAMIFVGEILAVPMAKMFVGYDANLTTLTVSGFRVYALAFAFMGFAIFDSGFFTALNDGLTSALISFIRTMVFQTAAVMLLPLIWEIDGVWASIMVAEFMAALLGTLFIIIKKKRYGY